MGPGWTAARTAIAVVVTLVLTGCAGGSPEPSPAPAASSPPTASLESTIQRFMDDGVSSIVVQVRWPGGEWSRSYGQRGPDGGGPAQPQDRFSVGSVTKSMVAAAVLQLVDDGLIGLDDPVNGLLESFSTTLKPPGPITVRQLLNHTSGMPDFVGALDETGTPKEVVNTTVSMQRGLELVASLPWNPQIVGFFAYSNGNYFALGQLIEKLRAKPLGEVLTERIFRPLGLEQTSLGAEDRGAPNNLRAYILVDGERVDVTQAEYLAGSPAGGVVSTAEDVNDFYRGLLSGGLLSPSALVEMKAVISREYGLGLARWRDGCSSTGFLYGHIGGVYGYRTVSMASDDGDTQITIAMALPTLPAKVGDPVTSRRINHYSSQLELAARKALDHLCE